MQTYHEPRDMEKVAELAASMEANGWIGAPLVTFGDDQLLTGAHRYTAAKSLDWSDREIPTIGIEEIFAEAGLDFAAEWAALMDEGMSIDVATVEVVALLPEAVKAEYGIDIEG